MVGDKEKQKSYSKVWVGFHATSRSKRATVKHGFASWSHVVAAAAHLVLPRKDISCISTVIVGDPSLGGKVELPSYWTRKVS